MRKTLKNAFLVYAISHFSTIAAPFSYLPSLRKFIMRAILPLNIWIIRNATFLSSYEMRRFHEVRLGKIFSHVYKNFPYWQERLDSAAIDPNQFSLEDFQKTPLLTRKDIQENISNLLRPDFDSDIYGARVMSSGSTSIPIIFYNDQRTLAMRNALAIFNVGICYLKNGERLLNLFMPYKKRMGLMSDLFFYSPTEIIRRGDAEFIKFIENYKPSTILASPSALILIAGILQKYKINLPLRFITSAGETLTLELKKYFQDFYKCPILEYYGAAEHGVIALSCSKGYLHVQDYWVYVEVLGDNGEIITDGREGNIVTTQLHNWFSPLIRYVIGDRGTINYAPCSCGRNSPRISVKGRSAHFIILKDGKRIPFLNLLIHIYQFAPHIRQYQFEQPRTGSLILNLVLREDANPEVVQLIRKEIIRPPWEDIDLEIRLVLKIPFKEGEHKFKVFIPLDDKEKIWI